MDTSKKYIRMCEKAEEIQSQRHIPTDWQKGDWFLRASTPWVDVVSVQVTFSNLPIPVGTVWLPRLDQLQEIIIKGQGWKLHPQDIKTLLHNVCLSIEKGLSPLNKPGYYSMEQLWLAFVMKEKYHKIWKEDTWKDGAN